MDLRLPVPGPGAALQVVKDINGGIYILHHLEIEHAHADEIGPFFKGPVKSVFGLNGPGCKYFKTHYRHRGPLHKFGGLVRE